MTCIMNKLLHILFVPILLVSCDPEPTNRHLFYQNIIILSDLSSRLENKPNKDLDEIRKLIQYFRDECVKPGEKIGDKSCISFSTFSEKTIARVDISSIKQLGDIQQFINSTGKYRQNGLDTQLKRFEEQVAQTYATVRNKGLDLISILIDKIEHEDLIRTNTQLTNGIDTTIIDYHNHIYVFTDGYLEYVKKQRNDQFYFGLPEIERLRNYCKQHNLSVEDALQRDSTLGLTPTRNNRNQLINLHILETHERDKDDKLQVYSHIRGLRDNEILEAVWRKWAMDSGFKSFEWRKY